MNFLTVLTKELFIDIAGRIYASEQEQAKAKADANTIEKMMGIAALAMGLWLAFNINEFFISKDTILQAIRSNPNTVSQGIAQGFNEEVR